MYPEFSQKINFDGCMIIDYNAFWKKFLTLTSGLLTIKNFKKH